MVRALNDCGSTHLGQGRPGRGAGMSGKVGPVLPKMAPSLAGWLSTPHS